MKSPSPARVLFVAALGLAFPRSVSATPPPDQAYTHSVGAVDRSSSASVVRGSPMHEVLRVLGGPRRKLGDDVWIYRNFHPANAQSPGDTCSTLVITFVKGEVSDLQLVNDRAEIILAARFQAKFDARLQVAAK